MVNFLLKKGQVIRIVSEYCTVRLIDTKQEIICKARGVFRHNSHAVVVGDFVTIRYDAGDISNSTIYDILDRKNLLLRPKIANIDQAAIIVSVKNPRLSTLLINKCLAYIELSHIPVILIFTKIDLITEKDTKINEIIKAYCEMGYSVIKWSNKKINFKIKNEIIDILNNKITLLEGTTGVGKSSFLNVLIPGLNLKTQEISKALNRGKNTTTHIQFYQYKKGEIADSPGFSSFNLSKDFNWSQFASCYRIFQKYILDCKFRNCLHYKENECAIKDAVKNQLIPVFFYEDYIKILKALMNANMKG